MTPPSSLPSGVFDMYCRFFTLITLVIAWSVNAQDIQSVSRDIDRLQADISVNEETRTAAINLLTNARKRSTCTG
jgi:hypothetical protein